MALRKVSAGATLGLGEHEKGPDSLPGDSNHDRGSPAPATAVHGG